MQTSCHIGIIGAGFAGLVAALRLKKSGRTDFIIFEKANDIGGTWRDNVYPGCACDIASSLYSFADEPNPGWSRSFSGQEEILQYMKHVVDKNDLAKHIRFNTNIREASFQQDEGVWLIKDDNGNITTAKILIAGLGPLNRPKLPSIPGMDIFRGKVMHSAMWDKHFDCTGKKVAVVGTGASAIQVIPNIAPIVDELLVFQRTAAWVTDRNDKKISPYKKKIFKSLPFLYKLQRELQYWINEFFGLAFIGNKTINNIARWVSVKKLEKEVRDPETRRKLLPDYTIGCKRVLKSDDYYPTFNRDNVELITDGILSFSEDGVTTSTGQFHKLDAVIFCTGFHVADFNYPVRVYGLNNKDLFEHLRETGGAAYKGTTISGYPNLCFLLGPNTGLGHNSVVHMMESQMNYVMQYIRQIEQLGPRGYADVKTDIQKAYYERIQEQLKGTVWSSGCSSWYLNEQGLNNTIYPRLNSHFRKLLRRFNPSDYLVYQ